MFCVCLKYGPKEMTYFNIYVDTLTAILTPCSIFVAFSFWNRVKLQCEKCIRGLQGRTRKKAALDYDFITPKQLIAAKISSLQCTLAGEIQGYHWHGDPSIEVNNTQLKNCSFLGANESLHWPDLYRYWKFALNCLFQRTDRQEH